MVQKTQNPKPQKRDWSAEGGLPYEKIPAFKAAFDLYKECQLRFKNVPLDAKPIARDTKSIIMRVMVLIAHAKLNIRVRESLQQAVFHAIETQVTLRVMVDTHAITYKDFANISKFSDNLVRQMVGWSTSEERKAACSPDLFSSQQQ